MSMGRCHGGKTGKRVAREEGLLYCFTTYSQFGFMTSGTQLVVDPED